MPSRGSSVSNATRIRGRGQGQITDKSRLHVENTVDNGPVTVRLIVVTNVALLISDK